MGILAAFWILSFHDDLSLEHILIAFSFLNLIIPTDDNMKNFPYIIEHLDINGKLKYGYIIFQFNRT